MIGAEAPCDKAILLRNDKQHYSRMLTNEIIYLEDNIMELYLYIKSIYTDI